MAVIQYAVEFAVDKAKDALKDLTSFAADNTVGIAKQVLAPLSPANLVTQIAQQGLGINPLASNLVEGGLGLLGQSRFGYAVSAGQQFRADSNALQATLGQVGSFAGQYGAPSDDLIRSLWSINLSVANAQESGLRRVREGVGVDVARRDAADAVDTGTKLYEHGKAEVLGFLRGAREDIRRNYFPHLDAARYDSAVVKFGATAQDLLDLTLGNLLR